jgi:hypothetical protein
VLLGDPAERGAASFQAKGFCPQQEQRQKLRLALVSTHEIARHRHPDDQHKRKTSARAQPDVMVR